MLWHEIEFEYMIEVRKGGITMKVIFWSVIIVFMLFSQVSNAATFLYLKSEPGDYIGLGKEQTLTTDDGIFTATGSVSEGVVTVSFEGTSRWDLNFAAPGGEVLQPGSYENAACYPFQSPIQPGLSVYGDGRGCNTLTGSFDILEISYTLEGEIERFAANFEQHCEGNEPALFGSIRYNASVGFPLGVTITANDKHTPIIVKVGETVKIKVTTDAGDDEGILAEHWLGISGTYGTKWFNGEKWVITKKRPRMWFYGAIVTKSYTFDWTPEAPGVYMFQFVVDKLLDKKLNTQFVDHVVITVLSN